MQKIIWIVIIVIIALAAYIYFSPNREVDTNTTPAQTEAGTPGEEVTAEGTVFAVNLEGMAVDGPALITIDLLPLIPDAEAGQRVVAVPSMEMPLCAARENIIDVSTLTAGQPISVRGEVDGQGRIVPCMSASHYLRLEATQ